ncbi:hypothetical protein BDV10DRAFT_173636 [Aspergillus recurvatus]
MISLQDKITVITGASSGIGLATAQLFLEQGAFVHGVDVIPAPSALLGNPTFKFRQVDLRQSGSDDSVVSECQQNFGGRIDILLNIASVMDTKNSVDTMDPNM